MNSVSDWFREWFDSPYYHQLYFDRDEKEATAFIGRLLSALHPPTHSRMLDLACGRGRHALILAEKGFDVTGIDLSARSIAYARQFEKDNLHFYQHDMRQTYCVNVFDYVFNFFTSFGYFRTEREHHNVIRTVSLSLKDGGYFVLDYLNTSYAEEHLIPHSRKEIDGVHYDLTRYTDQKYFYKKIRIEDRKSEVPLEYTEKVARFSLEDFRRMFSLYGLQIREIFGNYELDPYDPETSPRLLLVARRRPSTAGPL
ncbi:MAG TPA: methyltransferase domain-containing protein [Puia sp.]|jgi:SAM-dependent methyltransferase|nr:methyltransferase domain-containing protein [Puia sp.]